MMLNQGQTKMQTTKPFIMENRWLAELQIPKSRKKMESFEGVDHVHCVCCMELAERKGSRFAALSALFIFRTARGYIMNITTHKYFKVCL